MLEPRAVSTAFSSSAEPPTPVMITLSGTEEVIALLIVSDAGRVRLCVSPLRPHFDRVFHTNALLLLYKYRPHMKAENVHYRCGHVSADISAIHAQMARIIKVSTELRSCCAARWREKKMAPGSGQ